MLELESAVYNDSKKVSSGLHTIMDEGQIQDVLNPHFISGTKEE